MAEEWSVEETRSLIHLWGLDELQKELGSNVSHDSWSRLYGDFCDMGYMRRSFTEVKRKIEELKSTYERLRCGQRIKDTNPSVWEYWEDMQEILETQNQCIEKKSPFQKASIRDELDHQRQHPYALPRGCVICGKSKVRDGVSVYQLPQKPGRQRLEWLNLFNRLFYNNKLDLLQVQAHLNTKYARAGVCNRHFFSGKPSQQPGCVDFVPNRNFGKWEKFLQQLEGVEEEEEAVAVVSIQDEDRSPSVTTTNRASGVLQPASASAENSPVQFGAVKLTQAETPCPTVATTGRSDILLKTNAQSSLEKELPNTRKQEDGHKYGEPVAGDERSSDVATIILTRLARIEQNQEKILSRLSSLESSVGQMLELSPLADY